MVTQYTNGIIVHTTPLVPTDTPSVVTPYTNPGSLKIAGTQATPPSTGTNTDVITGSTGDINPAGPTTVTTENGVAVTTGAGTAGTTAITYVMDGLGIIITLVVIYFMIIRKRT
jgi:hypothetical protein